MVPKRCSQKLLKMGATDGLPVIPATTERVQNWLRFLGIDSPRFPLTVMIPSMQTVTYYDLVVNAIMAGATAPCLPVIKSAVQAICEESFNLLGIQTTTGGATPAILVSGSIRNKIESRFKAALLL